MKEPPVRIFVMGANRWRFEKEWPPKRVKYTPWYLHGNGKANTASGDGSLSPKAPSAEPADKYVYDPANPVPTLGGTTLRVMSAAPSLPNWLLKKIHTLEITDENEYHKTARQKIRAHVFWDPEFLKAKKNLYAEMGRQFGSDTNLKVVGIAFANTHSEDWSVPVKGASRAAWLTAGYTPERFIDAGKQTLDAAMTAFPNSAILLAVGNNPLDTDTLNVPRTVIRYANERYPGRLIVQLNRLAAKSPLPAEANGPWKLLMENRPFVAGQMLWNVSGDSSYRMNKKMPGNPRQILSEAIEKGFAYGMCYIEVYVRDILDPGMRPVLAEASAKMHSS